MKRLLVGTLIVVLSLTMVLVLHDQQEMRERLNTQDYQLLVLGARSRATVEALNHTLAESFEMDMYIASLVGEKIGELRDELVHTEISEVLDNVVTFTRGGSGHASGVILHDGFVATAKHCTSGYGATGMEVQCGGIRYEVTHVYEHPNADISILEVPGVTGGVVFADEHNISIMDTVYVVGTPYNVAFDLTISRGMFVDFDVTWKGWTNAYRVSADAGPGNSGGPVFDTCGRLIGLVVGGPDPGSSVTVVEPVKRIIEALVNYE
jgi:S1-C subfamily serine protease